jgi:hypothetical protein
MADNLSVTKLLNDSLIQLAAESRKLQADMDRGEMIEALMEENRFQIENGPKLGYLAMTRQQAEYFADNFQILKVQQNDAWGDAGVIVKNIQTGFISVGIRSTESRPTTYGGNAEWDRMANAQMLTYGDQWGATLGSERWVKEGLDAIRANDPTARAFLVGYSKSGNQALLLRSVLPDYFHAGNEWGQSRFPVFLVAQIELFIRQDRCATLPRPPAR